ncbi:MAG: 4-hydroxybenzoate octaprenyltransferase [Nitrospirota bacterium]|nr:4-hydroxybenzoate octaprenyltransferase [Nitrospirota bacterium]
MQMRSPEKIQLVLQPSKTNCVASNLASLIRLKNQTGTLLLALPSLWALALSSDGAPSLWLLLIFLFGAFIMRSAGVIMNDLVDQSFDQQIKRTKNRPLASKALNPIHALVCLGCFLSIALSLLFFLNPLTRWLSLIALALAAFYPFTKRFFDLPQFFLGLAFGWGAIMAWAATQNQLTLAAWLLMAATILWALAYDTIYALQDTDDDIRVGVKSSAILFGAHVWIAVGIIEILMIGVLALVGWLEHLNLAFYGGLTGLAGFLSQQVWCLRGKINPAKASVMFKQHVGVGFVVLTGIWLGTL